MKALFIGGTGTISTAVSALAVEKGIELTLLNRGTHLQEVPKGARVLRILLRKSIRAHLGRGLHAAEKRRCRGRRR